MYMFNISCLVLVNYKIATAVLKSLVIDISSFFLSSYGQQEVDDTSSNKTVFMINLSRILFCCTLILLLFKCKEQKDAVS